MILWVLQSTLSTELGCGAHYTEICRTAHSRLVDAAFMFVYCFGFYVQMLWMLHPIPKLASISNADRTTPLEAQSHGVKVESYVKTKDMLKVRVSVRGLGNPCAKSKRS